MSNKGRSPDHHELSLWDMVKKTISPIHPRNVIKPETSDIGKSPSTFDKPLVDTSSISVGRDKHATSSPQKPLSKQLDRRTDDRLRKGKMAIEAVLDMHGMTQEQAHSALNGFVTRAFSQQKRCVLVITGKGSRSDGEGVLKSRLPQWIALDPINNMVLKSVQAHRKHGGTGAFYLYFSRVA